MAGTTIGGIKARDKNLAKDPDFYKKAGAIGGKNGTKARGSIKGFDANRELAKIAGARGGKISKRTKKI